MIDRLQLSPSPQHGESKFIGAHRYVFDSVSTQADDGATVLCPVELMAEDTDVLSPGQLLTHTDVIFASVAVQFSGYEWTDWQLHGHTNTVNGNNPTNIDHATGRITTPSVSGEKASVTYKYALTPGRWIKQFAPGEALPLSLLGIPDDRDHNNYEAICWSLLIAERLGRPLLIDGVYWHWGGTIELPHNAVIRGPGAIKIDPERVMLRFRHDDAENAIPWEGVSRGWFAGYQAPLIVHKPNCKRFEIHDLEIDGGALDWSGWGGEFFDLTKYRSTPQGQATEDLARAFQNSPVYAGLCCTNQNGRPVDGLSIRLERCKVHNWMACAFLNSSQDVRTIDCEFGNCVGNRPVYRAPGHHENLSLFGCTRGSVIRIGGATINGCSYSTRGFTNPWSENAGLVCLCDPEEVPSGGELVLNGIDWDFTNAGFNQAFRGYPQRLRANGILRNCGTILAYNDNSPTVYLQDVDIDVRCVNDNGRPTMVCAPVQPGAVGRNVRIRMHADGEYLWPPNPIQDWPAWNSTIPHPPRISVARIDGSPERQHYRLELHDLADRWSMLWLPDLGPTLTAGGEIVPTVIELSGAVHNRLAWLLCTTPGATEQQPTSYQGAPVLVRCKDLTFDFPGANPYLGQAFPRSQLEIMEFTNCRTYGGRLSEDAGELEIREETAIDTRLFTWPKNTQVCGYCTWEWVGTETIPQLKLTPYWIPKDTEAPILIRWQADFRSK